MRRKINFGILLLILDTSKSDFKTLELYNFMWKTFYLT